MKAVLFASALIATTAWAQPEASKEGKAASKPVTAKEEKVKGVAHLRVLHAIPDAPAADVYFDDKKVATGAGFKTMSDYVSVASGKTVIKLNVVGKTEVLLQGEQLSSRDGYYTVVAYGSAAKPLLLVQNDNAGKVDTEKARLRAFHLVADAPEVDITTPSTRAQDGAADIFTKLAFGNDSTKLIKPGKLSLQVRSGNRVFKELPNVTLEAGKRYAVFVLGKVEGADAQNLDVIVKPSGN
jgi:Domain of unknown function (DUF4397)